MEEFRINGGVLTECCRWDGFVTVPDGVERIEKYAFSACQWLTGIFIPDSVTVIDDGAFRFCGILTEIRVGEGNPVYRSVDGNLYSKDGKTLIRYASGKKAKSFCVPDGVTAIGEAAFVYCGSITAVELPDSVRDIGRLAFGYCGALAEISVPKNVTIIRDKTFERCRFLSRVTLPEGLRVIGSMAFHSCLSLVSISIPEGTVDIKRLAFGFCGRLERITVPEGITKIKEGVFFNCLSLKSIRIPDGVTRIGESAFSGCRALESVNIPEGTVSIGKMAFWDCGALKWLRVPDGIQGIGEHGLPPVEAGKSIAADVRLAEIFERALCRSYHIGAIRGFLERYRVGTVGEEEKREWLSHIRKRVPLIFNDFHNEPAWYGFVTEYGLISHRRVENLLKETADPECRALLLAYGNRSKNKNAEELSERYGLE